MDLKEKRLMVKALVQRWPLDPRRKREIVEVLARFVSDENQNPRERISAARALLAAEAQNQSDEHKVLDGQLAARDSELSAIAADLGIDPRLIVDAACETDSRIECVTEPSASVRPSK